MLHDSLAADPELTCTLPDGFKLLQGQYQIERPLLSGGFGITYLARDSLDRRVVIKECFPAGMCTRSGAKVAAASSAQAKACRNVLRAFLREARWLARPQHPNIVAVHQVFKENNTAYIAMEFVDGLDLLTIREEQPERLTAPVLNSVLAQALDALGCLHGMGILHRDVAPDNFLLDRHGRLTLIDFGAACGGQSNDDVPGSALLPVKDGYSAHELYKPDLPQRPSSDLYSLAATMHFLITGEAPPDSRHRLNAIFAGDPDPCLPLAGGGWPLDRDVLASIDKALSVLPAERFQSAASWAAVLPAAAEPAEQAGPAAETPAACIPPGLDEAIADLVASTNSGIARSLPRSVRGSGEAAVRAGSAGSDAPIRPLVDIFGEPVSDLEAWLEEQDRLLRKPLGARAAGEPQAESACSAKAPPAPSLAGRLIKFFGRGRGQIAAVQNQEERL